MTILQTQPTEVINLADSAKVAITGIAYEMINDPSKFLQDLLHDAISFGLKVLAALLIYIIGIWLIKRFKRLLAKVFKKKNTEATLASFLMSLMTISMTVLLIIVTVSTLGVNTTSLAAILAAGGMAIGMALSGTVQNFAGGLMILIFKPFKAGDYIDALGYSGKVSEVNIVSTKLVTFDNKTIILPNGSLFNSNICNNFEHELNRLEWLVCVDYNSDNEKVKNLLLDIIKSDERILNSTTAGAKDPFIALHALKDSSVEYVLRAWVRTEDYWAVKYSINEKIFTTLPANGIKFPFPQIDIHMKN